MVNAIKGKKGFISIPIEKRFWSYVKKTKTCWLWVGSHWQRYGTIFYKGRTHRATHISWFLHYGTLPKFVCHKCDNPPCVRPDHLFLGDHKANTRDMINKGRKVIVHPFGRRNGAYTHPECVRRGTMIWTAKLDEGKVISIRNLHHEKGLNYNRLGEKFNVSADTISLVCRRRIWTHI